MDQTPNSRPLKKRHTKPCKYFQTMSCPRSADECHFSHTLAYEKQVEQCRYFVVGNCSSGEWCRYSHTWDAEASYAVKQRNVPSVLSISPNHIPYHELYTQSPMWTPYGSTYIHSNNYVNQPFISPTDQRHSESSGTSQSGSSCDDVTFTTEDPGYEEHPHSHQSQILVSEEPSVVHVPPVYPSLNPAGFPPTPAFLAFPPVSSTMAKVPKASGRPRSRSNPRQKLTNYRTKPCKFFTEENGCPRGDRCTFIHINNKDGPSNTSNNNAALPATQKAQEDTQEKNYFPVNWRVIGGGVPVSNKRGRSFSEADCTNTVVAPEFHRTTSGALDSTQPEFSKTPFPPIGEERDDNAPAKPSQRARANSIPTAPRMTRINSNTLFAAESPGGL